MPEPIDVVITWVDDTWPGYRDTLHRYARRPVDANPNRTRDNLDLLKYSLRSLARYMPWMRQVILVTANPQVPRWLDTRAAPLRVVHHDAIFAPEHLPCFNSFAIVANLRHITGLSRRFLYVEDDRILGAPVTHADLFAPCGRPWLYATSARTDRACAVPSDKLNPWNAALSYSNHLLDAAHGPGRRRSLKHAPVVFDMDALAALDAFFPAAMQRTRASRFRAPGNVAVEHLCPWDMWHRGQAVTLPRRLATRATAYHGLDNFLWRQRLGLWRLSRPGTQWMCLNDNFGAAPNPTVVQAVRAWLERMLPWPSPFERTTAETRAG